MNVKAGAVSERVSVRTVSPTSYQKCWTALQIGGHRKEWQCKKVFGGTRA